MVYDLLKQGHRHYVSPLIVVVFLLAVSISAQETASRDSAGQQQVPVSTGTAVQPALVPGQQNTAVAVSSAPAGGGVSAAPKPQRTQQEYTVWLWQESRDCLWNLAKKYYGDPWLWKKIYLANRNQIADPGVIYPKQVLIIPPLDDSER